MIKFFRHIRQILVMENNDGKPAYRTGRYLKYAFGEIILVMIGILLALQVNNWNNERIQKKKEVNYIKNINKEFLLNRAQLDSVTFYHFNTYNNATKILNLIPIDLNTVNIDSISLYISKTFYTWTFNPQQSTINSLTNTSSFEIISNLELRELLQNWDELANDYMEEELIAKESCFKDYFPFFRKHISFLSYSKDANIFDTTNADYTFLNSLEFQNAVAFRRELVRDIIFKYELKNVRNSIDRIIALTTSEKDN